MFVIIVGAGEVGKYLLKDFVKRGYELVLVEQDREKCISLNGKDDISIVYGDGTKKDILEKAGAQDADVLLAVTGDDHDNLAICKLAERKFAIPQTFTRVNKPGNERLFNWLGVNVSVSSASILSALVNQEGTMHSLKSLLQKDQDELKLIRTIVSEESGIINKKLRDIELPQESIIVTILRGDSPIVPRGKTEILPGDLLVALAKKEKEKDLIKIFS